MCTYISRHIGTYIHAYIVRTYIYTHVHTYTHNKYIHNTYIHQYTHTYIPAYIYTGCNRRNGPDFGRVFLRSNYTDITQNTYTRYPKFNGYGDIGQRSLKL